MRKYKLLFTCLLIISFFLTANVSIVAQEEIMTNDEVIKLTKAGLNESIIINKIRTSKSDFNLSTNELIRLKKEKVSDKIVNAMLEAKHGKPIRTETVQAGKNAGDPNDPLAQHSYGIYYFEEIEGENKMTQMKPNVSASTRVGGLFTSAITYGIGKTKTKTKLPNRNADFQIKTSTPVFYFYLDKSSGGLNTSSGIPSTTNEFALVKFHMKKKRRELTIGKANAFSVKSGLSKEYILEAETKALYFIFLNGALFLVCFFVMALTSYLKQKFNGTLKNKISFFEKLIARLEIKPGKAEE